MTVERGADGIVWFGGGPPRTAAAAGPAATLLAALLLALPAAAQPALDSIVPPSPAPASFIADGGPVLDAAARARLDRRIDGVRQATGGDVGVAVIPDIRGRAPAEVGVAVYRAWRIGRVDSLGSARRDLGALLLIVPKELAPDGRGECWITTGLGAEGELRDATAGTICRERVIPRLRERDYEGAIAAGVDGIAATFARATAGEEPPRTVGAAARDGEEGDDGPSPLWFLLGGGGAVVGVGAGAAALRHRRRVRPRPCPRGHGMMTRLDETADDAALSPGQRTEERVGSVDYDVWACASCDERLVIPYKRWSRHEGCPSCRFRTVEKHVRTVKRATTASTGLEEIHLKCANCGWQDVTRRVTPRVPPPTASSGSRGGGGGGRSFGGSGRTAGGGGGGSY
jgi:uncharacterized protein